MCRDNKKMFWQQGLFLLSLLTFILIRKHPTQLLLGRAEKDEDPARIFLKRIRSDLNSTLILNSKTKEENWVLGTDFVSSFPCHIHSHSTLCNVYFVVFDRTRS